MKKAKKLSKNDLLFWWKKHPGYQGPEGLKEYIDELSSYAEMIGKISLHFREHETLNFEEFNNILLKGILKNDASFRSKAQ